MATKTIEFLATPGLTLTLELYPLGSDTIANTGGDSATEATNRDGLYTATVSEAISGVHTAHIKLSGSVIAAGYVNIVDVSGIYRVVDSAVDAAAATAVTTGDGDVAVNHNYEETDGYRVLDSIDEDPVDNAKIEAFDADDSDFSDPLARTYTGSDGRWIAPLMLDAGEYVLVISKPGSIEEQTAELTVA